MNVGDDDRILGFTALGVEANELMAGIHVAMLAGMPYQTFRRGVFAHPTTSEGLFSLFEATPVAPA